MQTSLSTASTEQLPTSKEDPASETPEQADPDVQQETTDERGRKIADDNDGQDEETRKSRDTAALVLQRNYRGQQTRNKMNGASLDCNDRWDDALSQGKLKTAMKDQDEGKNDPASRWKRSLAATSQLHRGDGIRKRPTASSDEQNPQFPDSQRGSEGRSSTKKAEAVESEPHRRRKRDMLHDHGISLWLGTGPANKDKEPKIKESLGFRSKTLEQTQWLEMIDSKHRYGSNLKYYHQAWQDAETEDNFFRWLDRGDGKSLSLPQCNRPQLEKERITYLSAEQRLNYLVLVDDDGFLRWAKNDELVDTSPNKWIDAGHGEGIIPIEVAPGDEAEDDVPDGMSSASSISFSDLEDDDNLQENHQSHYTEDQPTSRLEKIKQRLTLKGASQRLLRKTVAKNTWIYVSDMQYNIFVGLKTSGTFQHSSFLSGGQVTCAGIIQCRNGQIQSLSPLSGHYRGSIEHYKAFISHLDDIDTDLSKVRIGKAEAIMWGLQQIGKASQKKQTISKEFKSALHIGNDESQTKKKQKRVTEEPNGHAEDSHDDGENKMENDESCQGKVDEFRRAVFYGRKTMAHQQHGG